MASTSIFVILAAGVVAFIALVTDVRARRIPNWVMHSAPTVSAGKAPYAVPIAIGVCLAMVLPPLVRF